LLLSPLNHLTRLIARENFILSNGYVFRAWYVVKSRDKFTFTPYFCMGTLFRIFCNNELNFI